MSLEDAVVEVLRPGGALEAELPSYESRPGQLAMARRVARAIEDDERLLVEAEPAAIRANASVQEVYLGKPHHARRA